jgi:phosphomannomutase
VGEANVVSKMKAESAVLGGEGNGGVIEPKVGYVRDSFVGMAYVLAGLAERTGTLSTWVDALPRYAIVKDKVTCPKDRIAPASAALKKSYSDARRDESDGLRLDWEDRWLHVRGSNTEPIIRVIAEAPDRETARGLCDHAVAIVRDAAGGAS